MAHRGHFVHKLDYVDVPAGGSFIDIVFRNSLLDIPPVKISIRLLNIQSVHNVPGQLSVFTSTCNYYLEGNQDCLDTIAEQLGAYLS